MKDPGASADADVAARGGGDAGRRPGGLGARAEKLAVLVLLVAALVPRLRDFGSGFDRGTEGWQGAFFAIAAVNYERLGLGAAGGYPVLHLDLPGAAADGSLAGWLVYTNHPPTVALLAWGSAKAFGPLGWEDAWRDGRSPAGLEPALRLPFLALHLAGLLALWWCVRESLGARGGLLALALAATTPALATYAYLVNYENPVLPFVLLAAGFHVRWLRSPRSADLGRCALCFFVAASFTWAPLFFVAGMALTTFVSRGARTSGVFLLAAGVACAVPLGIHAVMAQRTALELGVVSGGTLGRAGELLAPLLSGERPAGEWLAIQLGIWRGWLTAPLVVAAGAGAVASGLRAIRTRAPAGGAPVPVDVGLPLFLGGLAYNFAFYRHTLDGQTPFLMLLAPGAAALAATALDALAPTLARLRAGLAPLVVACSSIGLVGVSTTNELRYRLRSDGVEPGPGRPPALPLPAAIGSELRELLPAGSFTVYPASLGLNLAASWYAWRTLWPVPDGETRTAAAEALSMGTAPRYLLRPADASILAGPAAPVASAPPDRASEAWRVWSLDGQ